LTTDTVPNVAQVTIARDLAAAPIRPPLDELRPLLDELRPLLDELRPLLNDRAFRQRGRERPAPTARGFRSDR
jgi:hypothetical protein